ncbi:MAG: C10 family peptidase [Bacteroidales bacterium]|nr:C10 family peptidase [Bacteroidales bacterium]
MVHKKSVLTTVLFFLFVSMMFAAPISKKTAEQAALNWMSYYSGKSVDNITIKNVTSTEYKGSNVLYTFTFKEGGFVIVAGDDQAYPILAYSTKSFIGEEPNPGAKYWLDLYSKQIHLIKTKKLTNQEAQTEWRNILNKDFSQYNNNKDSTYPEQLLRTKWNQNSPWNNDCPVDSDGPGEHVYAGCTATAMAQIMKYWHSTITGEGFHSYSCPPYGTLSANFGNTTYDWNSMDNTTCGDEIQELLKHCGVSVDMEYGPDRSSAPISDACSSFKDYFRFKDHATYKTRISMDYWEWVDKIKENLKDGIPLLYKGGDAESSHAFVLDGYESSTNKYHFNFGWSGSGDGYYTLWDDLTPNGHNYNSGQAAIFDLEPDEIKFTFNLSKGWNFISMPVMPENTNPVDIFNMTNLEAFEHYSNGSWNPSPPWGIPVEPYKGYLLSKVESCDIVVTGAPVAHISESELIASCIEGWNMVGPGYHTTTINGQYYIYRYENGFKIVSIPAVLEPGVGYYLLKPGKGISKTPPSVPSDLFLSNEEKLFSSADHLSSYPNPFTNEVTVNYAVTSAGNVNLKIYNITGQLVKTLVNESKSNGTYNVKWDANDSNGNKMPNGTYFIRMQTGDNIQTNKVVLMR